MCTVVSLSHTHYNVTRIFSFRITYTASAKLKCKLIYNCKPFTECIPPRTAAAVLHNPTTHSHSCAQAYLTKISFILFFLAALGPSTLHFISPGTQKSTRSPGVVHQNVQLLLLSQEVFCKLPNGLQRSSVQQAQMDILVAA